MRRHCQLIGAAILAAFSAPVSLALPPPIYVIPLESRVAADVPERARLQLELHSADPGALAMLLRQPPPGTEPVRFVTGTYLSSSSTADNTWLEATFLIDHAERSVVNLHAKFSEQAVAGALGAQLVRFVSDQVDESMDRGFDYASRVARDLRGDCTEHAVLLAALARRSGVPARVVMGVVVVIEDGQPAAFGHAWTEIKEGDAWTLADAALAEMSEATHYIPLGVLEDESAGYVMGLARLMNPWVQRIVLTGFTTDPS